jgi:hypothetical protein
MKSWLYKARGVPCLPGNWGNPIAGMVSTPNSYGRLFHEPLPRSTRSGDFRPSFAAGSPLAECAIETQEFGRFTVTLPVE